MITTFDRSVIVFGLPVGNRHDFLENELFLEEMKCPPKDMTYKNDRT